MQSTSMQSTSMQSTSMQSKGVQADSSVGMLLGRLIDITLTYAMIIIVIAGAYPLLNKQLLQTF